MSIATNKGFVVGQRYELTEDYNHFPKGAIVTFKEDDGTGNPAFYCDPEYDRDGWDYLPLGSLAPAKADPVSTTGYSINVTDNSTIITVAKPLPLDVVTKILSLIGE